MARSVGRVTGKNRSAANTRFAMVPRNDVPRSAFDIQHTHKTTFDAAWLVPVYVDEVLPGDSIRLKMTAFCRLATPIVPLMDNLYLESFFFFVPNRLLWSNWERFMGEQINPTDTTEYVIPQVEIEHDDLVVGSLADYMGITMNGASSGSVFVSALPFRAYNRIFNEWFRDQDLVNPVTEITGDGPDDYIFYFMQHRAKRHDYFTSARPWPQKPMVTGVFGLSEGQNIADYLPQAGAPVSGIGGVNQNSPLSGPTVWETGKSDQVTYTSGKLLNAAGTDSQVVLRTDPLTGTPDIRVVINDLRLAHSVQVLMERNARGGTRYAEIVRSHFGVVSPDARLQRPEYLGGGRATVVINPVAQTSGTGADGTTTVLGELAGVGTAVANGHGFSQSFTEHGVILGLVSVRADLTYQQGISRMWFRRTQFDFYWPALAHLGEQAISSREIFSDGSSDDLDVFGYQERWSEYKYKPNRTSGRFRSTSPQPLDIWHLGQVFSPRPLLNHAFINENPPVDRVLQVGGEDFEQFLFDSFFEVRMVRPMPMFSIPGLGPRL